MITVPNNRFKFAMLTNNMVQSTKILSLSKYDAVHHGLAVVLKGLLYLKP
jgi:hypothetical protein